MNANQHPKASTPSGKKYMRMPPDRVTSQQDEIRQRAYQLYQLRGGQDGLAEQDWFEAEQEMLARR